MSLQDKINSAKPTTFLTDGLSEEEVRQAVEEGRKRVSDTVKLIIEIPKMALEVLNTTGVDWLGAEHILSAVSHGVPLDDIKAEIAEEICLTDNPYTKETKYTIEHLKLLEILDSVGKAESEE